MLIAAAAILAGFAAVVAAGLVWYGLAGRAVDDHPVCRTCGFDLFNRPAGQTACPECGADLNGPRAVRTGNRRRRPGPLYAGLAGLVFVAALTTVVTVHVARGLDAYRLVPDAWVERDARSTLASRQRKAWAELHRRFGEDGLSVARTARLVDLALNRQADPNTAWLTEVGDFVEAVRKAKKVPDDKWLRYAKQAPRLSLRTRKQVGREDPIVAEVVEDGDRVAASSVLMVKLLDVDARGDLVLERDQPEKIDPQGAEQIGTGSFSYTLDVEEDRVAMNTARAGGHAVEVAATLEVLEGHELDQVNAKPLFRERFNVAADFELVDRKAVTLEIIPDDSPELRRQIEAAIQVDSVTHSDGTGFLLIRHSATSPPVPTAFRVRVRQGKHEWKGQAVCDAQVSHNGLFLVPGAGFEGDRVDVFFEPDVDLARATVDMTRVWDGRLEFKAVPIQRPGSP